MGRHAPLFYEEPVQLVRGEGVWLEAADGTTYLDLYNNVPCVGHANPRVVDAISRQAATLNVHSRYLHEGVLDYVERLAGLHHDGLESVILACSGTEAIEIALSAARATTGQQGIICTNATYHGNSAMAAKLTALPVGHDRGGVRSISNPQMFRPLAPDVSEEALCDLHIEELRRTIKAFQADGSGFAGLILCSILANEGLPNAPSGWFTRATEVVREAGGVIIADEVQAGFARSGSWWGYETNQFLPDIVVMGKPMGNGVPMSGVISSHEIISGFRAKHRYFNTFASSPIQTAAGTAVIDEITDRNLTANAGSVGDRMRASLRSHQETTPNMGDVRGVGLFVGIDWVHPGTTDPDLDGAASMVEALKRQGMLLGKAGQHGNVLKIRPPLVFEAEHAELFLTAFAEAVAEVAVND